MPALFSTLPGHDMKPNPFTLLFFIHVWCGCDCMAPIHPLGSYYGTIITIMLRDDVSAWCNESCASFPKAYTVL